MTQLLSGPLTHRVLHRLTDGGVRGAQRLWPVLERVQPSPATASWGTPDAHVTLRPSLSRGVAELGLYRGHYERLERAIAARFVAPGSVCVDVGANIGIYTALLAGLVGPGGVVHAIEPSPPALRRLRELERLSQVTIHACAVGETPGSGHLAVGPGDSMHSTLRPGVAGERLEVRVMPLTDLVGATPVTFVKVDVEGYEEAVLAGMRLLLERHQVGAVMLEVEPDYGPPRWITELQHIPGYTLYAVAGKRRAGRVVACLRQDAPDRGTVLLVRNNGAPAVPVGR